MAEAEQPVPITRPAGLMRRLAAMLYDALVLLALEILATFLVLPLAEDDAFAPGNTLYRAYLLLVALLFFCWFWTHGGQTLGMRAWHLRVVNRDGGALDWRQSILRFFAAIGSALPLGLGYLWILFDRDQASWHDRLSRSQVVFRPKSQ
jgi:uncharacterized RDD family membrane protein YckC